MPPAPAGFFNAAEGRSVNGSAAVLSLRGEEPHFFPLPRPFIRSRAGSDRADHGSIHLGNHMGRTFCGQHSKRFCVLFFELFLRSLGMSQGRLADCTCPKFKSIVLLQALHRPRERVFTSEVRKHPLQATRLSACAHPQTSGQRAQVRLAGAAPDLVLKHDRAKDCTTKLAFFLHLSTVGSSFCNSRPTRSSA